MDMVTIGKVQVSRFIIGGNPFSGFSHQTPEVDVRMRHWFSAGRIKELLRQAESLGINTVISRADIHVVRLLMEYWDDGGKLQWLAQTCPEIGPTEAGWKAARAGGAVGVHVHGGVTDFLRANGRLGELQKDIDAIREAGLAAGIAGHNTRVFEFAEEHLDVDYYMCCYYNPTPRDKNPEHIHGADEKFREEDRRAMTTLIASLSKPVVHYKIMAAGRNDPAEAFDVCARTMRGGDAVCVGIYNEDKPDMLAEDVRLLDESLSRLEPVK